MNQGLTSLLIAVGHLCVINQLSISRANPMNPLERIEKFELMKGRPDLLRLYEEASPKWNVNVPDEGPELSFKVYYKGSRGPKMGIAIFEMTPEFFRTYSVFENTDFWEIPESLSFVPIYGVIWGVNPKICHCGD